MRIAKRAKPKRIVAESMPFEEVERIDRRLVVLGRGVGGMRLGLGEGLMALDLAGGVKALGFSSLGAYAREALGVSGRYASDARALARRLSVLPELRSVLVSGRWSWSKVELLAKVATADDEAEHIVRAETMTVRALRAALRDSGDSAAVEADEQQAHPRKTTLHITVDRLDAMAFEQARIMVQALGARGMDGAVEAMLAEGLSEIVLRVPGVDLPDGVDGRSPEAAAWREELLRMRREGEEACEARGFFHADDNGDPPGLGAVEVVEPQWPAEVVGIDRMLCDLMHELAGRDLELGQLARRCFESDAWLRLGYASFEQYVRERIGLSAGGVHSRIALARRVARLPEIASALVEGRIGFESAALIARVASPRTMAAWVQRAEARTVRMLREEVEAVELIARVEGTDVGVMAPPNEEALGEVEDVERTVIAGLTDGPRMSEGPEDESEGVREPVMALPTRTLKLRVSEDTARFWWALERTHAGIWTGGSFVAFLASAAARAWRGAIEPGKYTDVYVRDRWRCRSPTCGRQNVSPHHVVFRAHGGGEGRCNLLTLCEICHLELVHGGALKVRGDASVGGVLEWHAPGWRVIGRSAATASDTR